MAKYYFHIRKADVLEEASEPIESMDRRPWRKKPSKRRATFWRKAT